MNSVSRLTYLRYIKIFLFFGAATFAVLAFDASSSVYAATALTNDVSVAVSLSGGEEAFYSIQVPADASELQVTLSGGTGDLDLYTKQGTPPNTASYDCRPYLGGNNETCTHPNPAEGTWYIMVRGFSSGTSTLTATYTAGSGGSGTELSNGVPEAVSLAAGEEKMYSIQVPANVTKLEVKIAGGSGDLDLYTQQGTPPDTGSYTCRP
ncbi:MAG: hypothetical protein D3923_13740, partial [Candidatus Electrothrix sp. AR3]|nr:hypothetical protein [Candidatus Electrothrix sp. AR3]